MNGNDARANDNEALGMAAENGHVDVLKELRENYKLTKEDAKTVNQDDITYTSDDVIRELIEGYGLHGLVRRLGWGERDWGLLSFNPNITMVSGITVNINPLPNNPSFSVIAPIAATPISFSAIAAAKAEIPIDNPLAIAINPIAKPVILYQK